MNREPRDPQTAPGPLLESLGPWSWRLLPIFAVLALSCVWLARPDPTALTRVAQSAAQEDWWIVKPFTGKSL